MFAVQHVRDLPLPQAIGSLGAGTREPERYDPLGDVVEVHARLRAAQAQAHPPRTCACAGLRRQRRYPAQASLARRRWQHLQHNQLVSIYLKNWSIK